jgi:hypothetical protein
MGKKDYSSTPVFIAALCLRLAALWVVVYILGKIGAALHDFGFLFVHIIH